MIYQGSKARLRKYIVPIIQKCIDDNKVTRYIEPFVGGANIIDHIKCKYRFGTDDNTELIALLKYMQKDNELSVFPKECSFEHYKEVREARKNKTNQFSDFYTAGIGYFASYGGRYFDGGYGRDARGSRSVYLEMLKNAIEQSPALKEINFQACDFSAWKNEKNCVFYCDPPYKNTKSYNGKNKFNYERFYDFCRELSKHNYVFISEYSMPDDFKCIWSKERNVMQKSDRQNAQKATEKLFIWNKR